MSRSRRKTPIFGNTGCPSEKKDKKHWHGRWRAKEREALLAAARTDWESHLPVLENQAGDVWSMRKDGKSYWSISRQRRAAEKISRLRGRTPQESESIKHRLLHKWMAK